ncbi:MAG: sel1 repeat family protein [Rhodospirillaceae bacterium]|nr:sel1 repeat family protein [Rhodospirillaceae bacterium]
MHWFAYVGLALFLSILPPATNAATPEVKLVHHGIHLVGLPLPEQKFDIDLLAPADGVANIKHALDRIYKKSPFSVKYLETLKKNGRVSIVYDAAFPKKQMSTVTIAAFFPDFFQKEAGGLKQFLVVVGRFGVKWEIDKLAAVVVHELVGHGLQHYRGRGTNDRKIDRECEALIHEEKAYQDFGVRRDSRDMIRFRRDVRSNWCADFSRYLRDSGINVDKAWGFGKPDVPQLLDRFEKYIQHLRKTGVSGKAVAAAKAKRTENFAAFAAKAEKNRSAPDMLIVAKRYLKGIGIHRNARKGAAWTQKAAELGHAPAQHILGALYAAGHGLKLDPVEAYKWFTLAARGGTAKSKKSLKKIIRGLSAADIKAAKARIATWKPKSG